MAKDVRDYFRYFGRKADGSEGLLLDTLDFYSNHSAISMHVVGETENDIDFVLDREVKKILELVEEEYGGTAIGIGYKAAVLMLVAYCLRKYRPMKILYAGGQQQKWLAGFCQLLHRFHSEAHMYWLTQNDKATCDGLIDMKMPFAELLLPSKTFDVVLLDDSNEQLLSSMKETVCMSLRLGGHLLVLSNRCVILQAFAGDEDERYVLGDGWQISRSLLSIETRKALEADTMDGAVSIICQEAVQRIMLVQDALSSAKVDLDELLLLADEVEQLILLTYATLPSLEVKFIVNEWKRILLDYRLGWGKAEKVEQLGAKLLAELQQ